MKWNRDEDKDTGGAAVGCLILIVGGCACIGGLLFFFRFIYDLFCFFILK